MKAELIDHMGDDLMVVNAARVSFDKQSEWETYYSERDKEIYPGCGDPDPDPPSGLLSPRVWAREPGPTLRYKLSEKDTKLIRYLASHGHWTPFAHPQITIRETVPIFVARQRFKHMVGFIYNEVSRRYVDDEPEFFVPKAWRRRPNKSIKQGSGEPFGIEGQKVCNEKILHHHQACMTCYYDLLDEGVAPEQARMVLPQSMYTSYYVTGSLAAWARAYNLRKDRTKAQGEIADLAEQWDKIILPLFPISWKALTGE